MRVMEDFANSSWLAKSASRNTGIPGAIAGGFRDLSESVHEWGRGQFASSYARGGLARTAFGPSTGDILRSPFRKELTEGSPRHIANLKRLAKLDPENKNILKALKSAESSSGAASSMLKRVGGKALGWGLAGAFALSPMFTTPGGVDKKLRATAGEIGATAGFAVGAKVGSVAGAAFAGAISGGILAPVGFVVGGLLGGFAGDEIGRAVPRIGFQFADKLVASERQKRHLNWVNDATAFRTRKAATMRQQSLSAMNRGMMASRSVLGREAAFAHM